MKRGLVVLTMLVLLLGSVVPSHAWNGGWHGGWGGHGGWGWRAGCCWGGWRWPGAFVGGVALGAAVAGPYAYGYGYPAYDPYPSYYAPSYAPTTGVYPQAAYAAPQAPAVQREVVYANGRYVLYGDGVTQAWQWVWIPSASQPAPPQAAPPVTR
jgi:hypothetical protein